MNNTLATHMIHVVRTIMALAFLSSLQGCMYYYKVQTVRPVTEKKMKEYDSLNKYLILHQGDSATHLSNLWVDGNTLSGNLSVLPENRLKYKTTDTTKGNRYRNTSKHDETFVLKEVHLYITDSLVPNVFSGDRIRLEYSKIDKAEIYKKDKGRTAVSWIIPAASPFILVGILLGIIAISGGPGQVSMGM
jgi:hypothetical protein